MKPINERISENLTKLRKNAKLTQLEFAEQINYSDKAISKWEKGESLPSIDILEKICDFFNITLNDLTNEDFTIKQSFPLKINKLTTSKFIIICLCISSIWLLATIAFTYSQLFFNISSWLVFVWAVPISCIVGLIFNYLWGRRRNVFVLASLLIWTLLTSVYLQFLSFNLWAIFLLGIPLQISIILWAELYRNKKKEKAELAKSKLKEDKFIS